MVVFNPALLFPSTLLYGNVINMLGANVRIGTKLPEVDSYRLYILVGESYEHIRIRIRPLTRKRPLEDKVESVVPTPKRKRRTVSERGRALFSSGITEASPLVRVSLLYTYYIE